MRLTRVLVALVLFGVAFAYVEAAVVVYLRAIYQPLRREWLGPQPDELFPLLQLEHLEQAGPEHLRMLLTELGREFATLVMLSAAGIAVARSFREWLAGFMIAFGVWDIFFYVFLKLLIDWPASLGTWDILFLLPVPWVGPVISPVVVSVSMIAAGVAILWRESCGRPIQFRWFHWVTILGGGSIVVVAFCWDFPNISAGGLPKAFNWPLFILGEAVGLVSFLHAAADKRQPAGRLPAPPDGQGMIHQAATGDHHE